MKIQIKPNIIIDKFHIINYIGNDLLAQKASKILEINKQELEKVYEQMDIIRENVIENYKKELVFSNRFIDITNIDEAIEEKRQIEDEKNQLTKDFQQLDMRIRKLKNTTNESFMDYLIKDELKYRAENIIKQLKKKVHNINSDRQMIDEIVKQENMNYKYNPPLHTHSGDLNIYYYIEPIIDFKNTDMIVITDFRVRPLISETDLYVKEKKIE